MNAKKKSQTKEQEKSEDKAQSKKPTKPSKVEIVYRGPAHQAEIDGEIVRRNRSITISYERYRQLRRQPGFHIDKIKES